MSDLILSRALLHFWLFDWLGVDRADGAERETIEAMIDVSNRLAVERFLPCYRLADVNEPTLDAEGAHILPEIREALRCYAELGLVGAVFSPTLNGLGLPHAVGRAIHSIFASANVAAVSYAMLTVGNARLLSTHGSERQIEAFALPQIEGRWFGTMCLSEPQAGSSLTDIRTAARADGHDEYGARYRLTGNKMWISGGDQDASENIVHLVLAKTVNPDGTLAEGIPGISLFVVPKILPDGARNDIAVAGLNHKMGYRGTTNCLLNFGENAGAIGWRIGAEGQGLRQMFMMMNEARVGVGMGAAALGYRGYRHAVRYAKEREQGRLPGVRGGAPVAIIEHTDVRRMLLQAKAYSEAAVALCLYCAALEDEGDYEAEGLLSLLTPVAKHWPSEFALAANDIAIQVHGGYGYTRDFDVEQLWRDNRLNPIHEGTTGIQALDLLRRKILGGPSDVLVALIRRIRHTIDRAAAQKDLSHWSEDLSNYWRTVEQTVGALRTVEGEGAFSEATSFLRAFGHGVVAWLWLDQVLAAQQSASPLTAGVMHACRFFFEAELPQAKSWLAVVVARSADFHRAPDEVFL